MTCAGIISAFLAALLLEFAPAPSLTTVIVPSGFSVTIAGVSLERVSLWMLAAGGMIEAHPDKRIRTGKSRIHDSSMADLPVGVRFSGLFE
jgi:hypothetical protein